MHKICTKPAYMALQANERTNKNGHLTVFLFIFQRMDFSRLEWGVDAKGSGGRKAKKIPHSKRTRSHRGKRKRGMNPRLANFPKR